MLRRAPLAAALSLALAATAVQAQQAVPVSDAAYPGEIKLHVDATDLAHRVMSVHEEIPVSAGPLRLYYPQWLPGNHGPRGPVDLIGGLRFSANGTALPWRRDPLDMYSFLVDVPAGTTTLNAEFQYLSPIDSTQGRVVMTPEIIGLQWNAVVLYPAGFAADKIQVAASVDIPAGWHAGSALEAVNPNGDSAKLVYKTTDLDTLVDSPLLAGKYSKVIPLDDSARPISIFAVADKAKQLEVKPEVVAKHKALVAQADKVFASRHYKHYTFLASASDRYSGIGLEHHQSTEVGVDSEYFTDPKKMARDEVFAHEYSHSWDGKFRRGADLSTPHFNVPMQDSLLWVYEGQTQYWGDVLAARAGFRSAEEARDDLAAVAAGYEHREGRTWRSLADTTNQPIISARRPQAWRSWQRSEDYYTEGELIWLDADTLIREKSGGKKSLDDFARTFFGVEDGRVDVLPYTFDDVVKALNAVQPYDWAAFLHARVDAIGAPAPLDGLARAGWKLVYNDKPAAGADTARFGTDFNYSLGITLGKDNKIGGVAWNSVAFKAGLAPGMTLVAVNGEAASGDVLKDAVTAAKTDKKPLVLLVNSFDHISTVQLDYHDGLRYPHLERIPGVPDRLSLIHAPKK